MAARILLTFSLLAAALGGREIRASVLDRAHVTRVVNDVQLVEPEGATHPAKLQDVVRGDIGLRTGIKSRSELLFQDDTLSRIGPESYFRFQSGTRDITLEKGTLLLQVPKGLGGAKIHTAAVTASITGTTIMIEHQPKRSIKVMVLEGSLRLSANGMLGDSLVLEAGKMVIMKPDAKHIPDPVTVDLRKVVRTSKLINMVRSKNGRRTPLPSAALIEKEIARQDSEKNGHKLAETNLLIAGKGTTLLLASEQLLRTLDDRHSAIKSTGVGAPAPLPSPTPGTTDIGPPPTIERDGDPQHDQHTDERYGSVKHPVSSPIVINTPQDFSQHNGVGSVRIESNDSVTVNTLMKVSDLTSKKGHSEIGINSGKTSGTAISVTSSAQLLALMAAAPGGGGGNITFQSAGGDIDVTGGNVQADRGTVEMRNDGAAGTINLSNATLHGNVIKIGALGANGTLSVGGGTISADSTIKLYAGGSNGTVKFTDNVTLNGNSVKMIAGNTVTIFDGKVVTINGPTPMDVFTNNPNYTGFGGNASTTGTFSGQGANTHSFNQAPGY